MSILELIFFVLMGGFAGYGFATWQENEERKRTERKRRRKEWLIK